jgi:hypothetical protein
MKPIQFRLDTFSALSQMNGVVAITVSVIIGDVVHSHPLQNPIKNIIQRPT